MMQGWFELSTPAQAIPDSLKAKATLLGLLKIYLCKYRITNILSYSKNIGRFQNYSSK